MLQIREAGNIIIADMQNDCPLGLASRKAGGISQLGAMLQYTTYLVLLLPAYSSYCWFRLTENSLVFIFV